MYSTILVPLDGSKRAEAILLHVEELAQRYDATVVFLRVIEPVLVRAMPDGAHPAFEQQEVERRKEEAKSYLTMRQDDFHEKGIEARVRVVHGRIVETIIEAARYEGAGLIAIASHGRTGLSSVFYGSVAAGVLSRVERPLLLVRSRENE